MPDAGEKERLLQIAVDYEAAVRSVATWLSQWGPWLLPEVCNAQARSLLAHLAADGIVTEKV